MTLKLTLYILLYKYQLILIFGFRILFTAFCNSNNICVDCVPSVATGTGGVPGTGWTCATKNLTIKLSKSINSSPLTIDDVNGNTLSIISCNESNQQKNPKEIEPDNFKKDFYKYENFINNEIRKLYHNININKEQFNLEYLNYLIIKHLYLSVNTLHIISISNYKILYKIKMNYILIYLIFIKW